jgi:hypothetical protein
MSMACFWPVAALGHRKLPAISGRSRRLRNWGAIQTTENQTLPRPEVDSLLGALLGAFRTRRSYNTHPYAQLEPRWRGGFGFQGCLGGSIPSLAPLILFRWCQKSPESKKPAQCGLFVVCVKPAPATKVALARGAHLGQHPGKALAGNSLCRSTLSTPAKWR